MGHDEIRRSIVKLSFPIVDFRKVLFDSRDVAHKCTQWLWTPVFAVIMGRKCALHLRLVTFLLLAILETNHGDSTLEAYKQNTCNAKEIDAPIPFHYYSCSFFVCFDCFPSIINLKRDILFCYRNSK